MSEDWLGDDVVVDDPSAWLEAAAPPAPAPASAVATWAPGDMVVPEGPHDPAVVTWMLAVEAKVMEGLAAAVEGAELVRESAAAARCGFLETQCSELMSRVSHLEARLEKATRITTVVQSLDIVGPSLTEDAATPVDAPAAALAVQPAPAVEAPVAAPPAERVPFSYTDSLGKTRVAYMPGGAS